MRAVDPAMASKAFCSLALILLYTEATQAYAPPRLRSVMGGPSLRRRNRASSVATPEILTDRSWWKLGTLKGEVALY